MRARGSIAGKCSDRCLHSEQHVAGHCTNDPSGMAKNSNSVATFPHATKSHSWASPTSAQSLRIRLTNFGLIPWIEWPKTYFRSRLAPVPRLKEQKTVRLSPIDARIEHNYWIILKILRTETKMGRLNGESETRSSKCGEQGSYSLSVTSSHRFRLYMFFMHFSYSCMTSGTVHRAIEPCVAMICAFHKM